MASAFCLAQRIYMVKKRCNELLTHICNQFGIGSVGSGKRRKALKIWRESRLSIWMILLSPIPIGKFCAITGLAKRKLWRNVIRQLARSAVLAGGGFDFRSAVYERGLFAGGLMPIEVYGPKHCRHHPLVHGADWLDLPIWRNIRNPLGEQYWRGENSRQRSSAWVLLYEAGATRSRRMARSVAIATAEEGPDCAPEFGAARW